jgi:hypothetical protein
VIGIILRELEFFAPTAHPVTVDAVKQWKYSPTRLDGRAIPVTTTVAITFAYSKDRSPKVIAPLS